MQREREVDTASERVQPVAAVVSVRVFQAGASRRAEHPHHPERPLGTDPEIVAPENGRRERGAARIADLRIGEADDAERQEAAYVPAVVRLRKPVDEQAELPDGGGRAAVFR